MTVQLIVMANASDRVSPTPDEMGLLVGGLDALTSGRHSVYCVNPPLVKRIAAVPAMKQGLSPPAIQDAKLEAWRQEWSLGRRFIEMNGKRSFRALLAGRKNIIFFALLGTIGIYSLGTALFGRTAGLISAVFWATSPWVNGYGVFVQTDIPAAATGVFVVHTTILLVRHWNQSAVLFYGCSCFLGLWVGLAILTKLTWIILLLAVPVFLVTQIRLVQSNVSRRLRLLSAPFLVLFTAVLTVGAGYNFEDWDRPLKNMSIASTAFGGDGNRIADSYPFRHGFFESLPCYAPSLIKGLDWQIHDLTRERWAMMAGEWKMGGWWYYYIFVFCVKSRLSIIFLFAYGNIFVLMRCRKDKLSGRCEWLLAAMIVLLMTACSIHSSFNQHGRYLIPMLPFVYVVAATGLLGILNWAFTRDRRHVARCFRVLMIFLAAILISVESVVGYPFQISYSNIAFGGPAASHRWLAHSNMDWNHGWLEVRAWFIRHCVNGEDSRLFVPKPRWLDLDCLGLTLKRVNKEQFDFKPKDMCVIRLNPTDGKPVNQFIQENHPLKTFAYSLGLYRFEDAANAFDRVEWFEVGLSSDVHPTPTLRSH